MMRMPYRSKNSGVYVTLFAVGHSTMLLLGVVTGVSHRCRAWDAEESLRSVRVSRPTAVV